jgi:hypothetical protein
MDIGKYAFIIHNSSFPQPPALFRAFFLLTPDFYLLTPAFFPRQGAQEILNLQPRGNKAKPYQVKQVRNVILKHRLGGEPDAEA